MVREISRHYYGITAATFFDWHFGQMGSSDVVLNFLPQSIHRYSLSSTSKIVTSKGPPAEHIRIHLPGDAYSAESPYQFFSPSEYPWYDNYSERFRASIRIGYNMHIHIYGQKCNFLDNFFISDDSVVLALRELRSTKWMPTNWLEWLSQEQSSSLLWYFSYCHSSNRRLKHQPKVPAIKISPFSYKDTDEPCIRWWENPVSGAHLSDNQWHPGKSGKLHIIGLRRGGLSPSDMMARVQLLWDGELSRLLHRGGRLLHK